MGDWLVGVVWWRSSISDVRAIVTMPPHLRASHGSAGVEGLVTAAAEGPRFVRVGGEGDAGEAWAPTAGTKVVEDPLALRGGGR